MKVFDVGGNVDDSGEYILGAKQTGSHACYLIYGIMKPGEKGRVLKPGKGHEEIFLAARGNFRVAGDLECEVKEGQSIHLKGDETCLLENLDDKESLYVISGGHSGGGHEH
ncbi:MAG: hypothetical protein JSV21_05325 [Nitrospirota bacterium]|nr:MAG: hypothetical protein JSV21_05325 [Nitrospirota bacterium]